MDQNLSTPEAEQHFTDGLVPAGHDGALDRANVTARVDLPAARVRVGRASVSPNPINPPFGSVGPERN